MNKQPQAPMGVYFPTPVEAVNSVRQRAYANTTEERDTIHAVDRAATKVVRQHEEFLIEQGTALSKTIADTHTELELIQDELAEIAGRARRGEDVDLKAFQRLDSRSTQLLREVGSLPARMASLLEQLTDPLAAVDSIYQKYPSLQRPVDLLH